MIAMIEILMALILSVSILFTIFIFKTILGTPLLFLISGIILYRIIRKGDEIDYGKTSDI